MKRKELKDIGADSLFQLLKKANEMHIKKENFLQILKISDENYHLIYVK